MHKKLAFLLTFVLAALVAVVPVAAQDDIESVDPSGQTVVYWHQYSDGSAQGDAIAELINRFNTSNEYGITVEGAFQGNYTDIRELMNGAIISGELPNLVAGFQNDMLSYAADGAVVDLNPYIASATYGLDLSAFNQDILDANVFDGQRLGWPNQVSANVLVVNTTMLSELGFDGPATDFDTFRAIACAAAESDLTGAGDAEVQGYPIKADASNFETWVAARGGDIFDYEANEYTFDSQPVIDTLTFYADLYSNGCAYVPDSPFGNTDDFALGLNPMALGSSAGLPFILGGFEESGVEAEFVVTTVPGGAVELFLPSLIAVTSTPEQQLATWEFIKFLAEEESQSYWAQQTGYFPTRTAVADDLTNVLDAEAAVTPYLIQVNDVLNAEDTVLYSPPADLAYNAIRGLIAEAIADVTVNGLDPVEVATGLDEAADALYADAQ